jgi:hypothetical protein
MILPLLPSLPLILCAQAPIDDPALELAGVAYERAERRANVFTASSQDDAVVARDASGGFVIAWQSRRQQEGTYGVYARRYDASGTPTTGEVELNLTTRGMQTQPAVGVDGQGGVWFAWRSHGQDGDRGGIVARRFTPDLSAATNEVLVNAQHDGDQREPLLVGLADGGALIAWLTPDDAPETRDVVRARRLDALGAPAAAPARVDAASAGCGSRTPSFVQVAGGHVVAYGRTDADGRPAGIFARTLDAAGQPVGDEWRVDDGARPGIEPVLAAGADGGVVAAWLEARGEDYEPRWRAVSATGERGPVHTLPMKGDGYTSGLALASDGARVLLAWNRFADGPRREPGLFAQLFEHAGAPLEAPFRVTGRELGPQRVSAARGTCRALLDAEGRIALAWHGDADLEDGSAAHLTLLTPRGLEPLAAALPALPASEAFEAVGAEPTHEPPTFDPRDIELRPDTPALDPGVDLDFLGITNTGWTPPDPHMAVGLEHVVLMTNGAIAWLDKLGSLQFQADINGAGGFWGAQGAGGFVFDPEVIFDPHTGRFMAFACERAGGNSFFLLAISDDGDPNGSWFKYRVNVSPLISGDIDSPNIGVDDEAIYMTADFFSPDRFFIYAIDKSTVINGGAITATTTTISGRHSIGVPVNFDAGAPAQYLLWADEFTNSTSLRLYALTDPLGALNTQFTTVTVPDYAHPQDPPQQGTSSRPELFEARFWSCVVRDGYLWATHHQGSPARVRWYQIALNGWPAGGTPSLVQSGDVPGSGGASTFFGSIAVDAAGSMALAFARSSSSEFISMQRTFRGPSDALGTVRTPETIITSTSPETSGRWGDFSACTDDPKGPGTFWGHHEYRLSGWRTRVARWTTCPAAIATYCTTSPNSFGSGALINAFGTPSVSANDILLSVSGGPPGEFALLFYGEGQVANPLGDGTICIGSNFQRLLPAVQFDQLSTLARTLDLNAPPNQSGQVTVGSTWNFQCWYRDPGAGGAGFNFSNAVSITFCE